MEVMVFWLDPEGKRRGWARGSEEELEQVRERASEKLQSWIKAQNEALGHEEWTVGDFEEFVANVRETS